MNIGRIEHSDFLGGTNLQIFRRVVYSSLRYKIFHTELPGWTVLGPKKDLEVRKPIAENKNATERWIFSVAFRGTNSATRVSTKGRGFPISAEQPNDRKANRSRGAAEWPRWAAQWWGQVRACHSDTDSSVLNDAKQLMIMPLDFLLDSSVWRIFTQIFYEAVHDAIFSTSKFLNIQ